MHKILYLIPNLDYRSWTGQAWLLATHLPLDNYEIRVVGLGGDGPYRQILEQVGIRVEILGRNRLLDFQPLVLLQRLIQAFQPDVIHAWQQASWWALVATLFGPSPRVIVSDLEFRHRPGWLSRFFCSHLLRRAYAVTAATPGGVEALESFSGLRQKIHVIPPCVSFDAGEQRCPSLAALVGLPVGSRLVVVVGPLEADKGYRDVLWALDILHYLVEDAHLVVIGDGPARRGLEEFTQSINGTGYIHFVGALPDVPALLAQAELVWVLSDTTRGLLVQLEAEAAGRAVIAPRQPGLAPAFAPRGKPSTLKSAERISLARDSRRLLEDPGQRQALGKAARERCRQKHAIELVLPQWQALYEGTTT